MYCALFKRLLHGKSAAGKNDEILLKIPLGDGLSGYEGFPYGEKGRCVAEVADRRLALRFGQPFQFGNRVIAASLLKDRQGFVRPGQNARQAQEVRQACAHNHFLHSFPPCFIDQIFFQPVALLVLARQFAMRDAGTFTNLFTQRRWGSPAHRHAPGGRWGCSSSK